MIEETHEHYTKGVSKYKNRNYHEAIKYFEESIKKDPKFFRSYVYIGMCLYNLNQIDQAIEWYKKAIGINPGYAKAFNNLGAAYKAKGFLSEAIEAFKRACEIDRSSPHFLFNLANALRLSNRPDQALPYLRQAHSMVPHDFEIFDELLSIYCMLKKYKEAVSLLEEYIKIFPEHERIAELQTKLSAIKKKCQEG